MERELLAAANKFPVETHRNNNSNESIVKNNTSNKTCDKDECYFGNENHIIKMQTLTRNCVSDSKTTT